MATERDHVWAMLDDMLVFLSKRNVPTPERTYKLDGGWTLAMDDLRRFVDNLIAERDSIRAELARLQRNEDCVQRLIVWAAENGWNGVDNSKILDSFIIGLFDELRAELAAAKDKFTVMKGYIDSFERTLEKAGVPKSNSEGDPFLWNERVGLLAEQSKALAADNARLRSVLVWLDRIGGLGLQVHARITEALAATPAHSLAAHDAAVKVAVLREVAEKLAEMCKKLERTRTHPITWEACEEWILAEADRIEKGQYAK